MRGCGESEGLGVFDFSFFAGFGFGFLPGGWGCLVCLRDLVFSLS